LGSVKQFHGISKNGSYFSFQGIPYAEPPIGLKRFHDPEPVQPWNDVKDATGGPPAICPQRNILGGDSTKVSGDEDCLFLNIYTETLGERRPVLVNIHGGGFTFGSGAILGSNNSGEDFLLESGLVVVSLNYRLGPLGFLVLEGTNIQGNQAMKDQVIALRWIKENIAKFGGDPDNITIAGLSAGAISVHAQILSPMAKEEELFHRGISMSGTMLIPNLMEKTLKDSKRFFTNLCGFDENIDHFPQNMYDTCLYKLSYEEIVSETFKSYALRTKTIDEQVHMQKYMGLEPYSFYPIIDSFADDPFMPTHPISIIYQQRQKMVPWMTGIVADEGALFVPGLWKDMDPSNNLLQAYWGSVGANRLLGKSMEDITFDDKLTSKMIARFYVGKDGVKRENKQGLLDMMTDAYFAYPNTEAVKLHAKSSPAVYNYLFTYKGSASMAAYYAFGNKEAAAENWGVAHADDFVYMFRLSMRGKQTIVTENDKKMAKRYQQIIYNFARHGNPTFSPIEGISNWPPAQNSKAACVYMDIGLEGKEQHRMFAERMTFWNKLQFEDLMDKYAIDDEEEMLLSEIDVAIVEIDEDENEDSTEDTGKLMYKKGRTNRTNRRNQKLRKKQRRLAKKLRTIQC